MTDEKLFLYLNGELGKEESIIVERWIAENPEDFEKIKFIWEGAEIDFNEVKPDLLKAWDKINPEKTLNQNKPRAKGIVLHKKLLRYAAVIFLFISFGVLGYLTLSKKDMVQWVEYSTLLRDTMHIKLADGSTVTLNKNSKLRFNTAFNLDSREVILEGEAFFQVKKNPDKPFFIYAGKTTTKVKSTSFNVNANDTVSCIIVTVKSGKVAFYKNGNTKEHGLTLIPGEMGLFSVKDSALEKHETHDENFLAWKTKVLLFSNTPLLEVCTLLNQHFDTNIIISNPQLKKQKLTARFQNKSIDEILNSLDITLDIRHIKTKKGIELFNK